MFAEKGTAVKVQNAVLCALLRFKDMDVKGRTGKDPELHPGHVPGPGKQGAQNRIAQTGHHRMKGHGQGNSTKSRINDVVCIHGRSFPGNGREWQISENIRVWAAVPGPFPAYFIDLSTSQYRFEYRSV